MKKEMIKQTLNNIAELIYEDEIKEAEASLEAYANKQVIKELEWVREDAISEGATMIQIAVTERIRELKQD
tara:strand:+ start:813 stop:1025 length:213 start_codon:yes stop_codon:yes gene_type:complete